MDDCKFYEKILNEYSKGVDDIKVSKIDAEDACEKGGNFVSKVQRVSVYGTKGSHDFQTKVIMKGFSESQVPNMFKFDNVFQNEVIFYEEMLPLFRKYSKHMLDTPKCLYIGDFFVYEDLNESGFQMKPKGHRFAVEEAKLVLKEIAKLHSASLCLQQNEPETVRDLDEKLLYFVNGEGNEAIEKCLLEHLSTAIRIFEDMENEEALSVLRSLRSPNVYLKLVELYEKPTEVKVFNHGDLWGNNIFFKDGRLKIIDFQMIYYGSPGIDLTYFLWVNLDPEVRRGNLEELLADYLENLRKFSVDNNLNEKIIEKLTLKWIENEVHLFALNGLLHGFMFLPIFYMKPEHYMGETEDYNEDKWMKNMNESYKQTLIKLVLDFVDIEKPI